MTRLDRRAYHVHASLFVVALVQFSSAIAANATEEARRNALQVVCAPDKPLAHPGESVTLRAWVTDSVGQQLEDPVQIAWTVATGTIEGRELATWRFTDNENATAEGADVTARATVRHKTRGATACEVRVHLSALEDSVQRFARPTRHSGRAFLLPVHSEPKGYGLYTYLLFETPPRDKVERERYIKAIEAYLLVLDSITEMERYRSPTELNVTMLPVRRIINVPEDLSDPVQVTRAAEQVLAVYDYPRAKALLADLGVQAVRGGPYLLSRLAASADKEAAPVLFDMTHVAPTLVWDWIKALCALIVQERSWSEVTMTKLALNMRNVVAVSARQVPDVVSTWIRVLVPR